MKRTTILLFLVAFVVLSVNAQLRGPVAVSPASDSDIVRVGTNCPTFSWTSVEGALGYKVVVFETNGPNILSYNQMETIASPILEKEIQGQALSWTPSSEEGLVSGSMYVWYVQAVDGYGQGNWSEGREFKVEAEVQLVGIEKAVRKSLREKGMSEEAIGDILEDMKTGMKEVGAYGIDTEAYKFGPQDKVGIQGLEGSLNTFYGLGAGYSNTTGYANAFLGYHAGYYNTEGYSNTFLGDIAGYHNTTGNNNLFIGPFSGHDNTTGNRNLFIGPSAGLSNTTGGYNTFMGYEAGYSNNTGFYNTFVGYHAGYSNDTAFFNTFFGYNAGYSNTTGNSNTCIGYLAGHSNSTGIGNVFLGYEAGYSETGSSKLFIDNTSTSSPLIWGDFSSNILTVHGKLGVGTKSPAYQMEVETTGTNAILLLDRTDGAKTGFSASGDKAVFGTLSNHPLHCVINGIFRMELRPNGSMHMSTGARCTEAGVWVDASSREYKEDIQALSTDEAMDALQELKPMKYRYKKEKDEQYLGFIAEDVPELVASKDRKNMSAMDVVAVLTKVVQEQQKTISELQKQVDELKNRE